MATTEITLGNAQRQNMGRSSISSRISNTVNRLQDRVLQHSTGKICIISFDEDGNRDTTDAIARLKIYSPTGGLLYSQIIETKVQGGITLAEYSSTELLIVYGEYDADARVTAIILNINTFDSSTDYANTPDASGAEAMDRIGQLHHYSGYWYIITLFGSYSGGYDIGAFRIVDSEGVFNVEAREWEAWAHTGYTPEIQSFIDDDTGFIYFVCQSDGTYTNPTFRVYSCPDNTFSTLAVGGVNGVFPEASSEYSQPYSNRFTALSGAIYHNVSTTLYYLYFSWVYSTPPINENPFLREWNCITWVGEFNNTVTSGGLLEQTTSKITRDDVSLGTFSSTGNLWGWAELSGTELTNHIIFYNAYNGYYNAHGRVVVNDITDITGEYVDYYSDMGVDNIYIHYESGGTNIYKVPALTWSYQEVSATESYLYLDELVSSEQYSMSEVYTPVDSPLLTNKFYTFTYTLYLNGITDLTGKFYTIYVDGIFKAEGYFSTSTGKISISMSAVSAGTHNIKVFVCDTVTHAALWESDLYPHVYILSSTTGGDVDPTFTVGWITAIMPIAFIVFTPIIALTLICAKFAGGAGVIVGAVLGSIVGIVAGIQTSIIPTYTLYLLAIAIILTLVFLAKGSGGSGQ